MWGRSVFDNIRKFVQFQLTVNVVAMVLTLVGAFASFENPLRAVQVRPACGLCVRLRYRC
jgi:magnesium-transporting ATPase (P-type)